MASPQNPMLRLTSSVKREILIERGFLRCARILLSV